MRWTALLLLAALGCGGAEPAIVDVPGEPDDTDDPGDTGEPDDTDDPGDPNEPDPSCDTIGPYRDCTATTLAIYPASGIERAGTRAFDGQGREVERTAEAAGFLPSERQVSTYSGLLLMQAQWFADGLLRDDLRYRYRDGRLLEIRYEVQGGEASDGSIAYTYDDQGRLIRTDFDLDGSGAPERVCVRTWQDRTAEERCGDGLVQRLTHDDRWLLVRSESIREFDGSVRTTVEYTYRPDCQFDSYAVRYAEPINGSTGTVGTYTYDGDRLVETAFASQREGGGETPLFTEQIAYACP